METNLTRQERWKKAGELQEFYNNKYGTNVSKSAFYKEENPLTQKLVRYEITIGFDYKGTSKKSGSYEFYMPQETFYINALSDVEADEVIKSRVSSAVASQFNGGAESWVFNKLQEGDNVKVIRGIEKADVEYKELDVERIAVDSSSYTQQITQNIKIHSKKNNSEKKPYNYDVSIHI